MPTPDADLNRLLSAIADPTRRRILQTLKRRKTSAKAVPPGMAKSAKGHCLCAGDIEEQISLSQPTISHHMNILTQAGLVEAVKQGQWRWYRRNPVAVRQLLKSLRNNL